MLTIRKHRTGLVVLSALVLAAGIAASKLHARSETNPACKTNFIEVTSDAPACGFALSNTGTFTLNGQTLADPLVASYEDSGSGQKAIAARQVMLFPPSPSGRFRIVQACDGAGADALCWRTLVLDREKAKLQNTFAGRYGPEQWQSWSPDEQHVALVNKSEEAAWLHVIDPESGNSQDFPEDGSTENWTIEPQTLLWTGPRSFTVTVKTCEQCTAVEKEIEF